MAINDDYFYPGIPSDYARQYQGYLNQQQGTAQFSRLLGSTLQQDLGAVGQQARYDISSAYAAAQRQRDAVSYTPGLFTGTREQLSQDVMRGYEQTAGSVAQKAAQAQSLLLKNADAEARAMGAKLYNLDEQLRNYYSENFADTYSFVQGQELEDFLSDDERARAWYGTALDSRGGASGFHAYLRESDEEDLANWFVENQDVVRGVLGGTTGAMTTQETLDTPFFEFRKSRDPSIVGRAVSDPKVELPKNEIRAADGQQYTTYRPKKAMTISSYHDLFMYGGGIGRNARPAYMTDHPLYLTDEKQAAANKDANKYREGEIAKIDGLTFVKQGDQMVPVLTAEQQAQIKADAQKWQAAVAEKNRAKPGATIRSH